MPTHIKLYGDKEERFEYLKSRIEEEMGYEPSNPEVIGHIMAGWNDEDSIENMLDP
jgi:hypothetical protein